MSLIVTHGPNYDEDREANNSVEGIIYGHFFQGNPEGLET